LILFEFDVLDPFVKIFIFYFLFFIFKSDALILACHVPEAMWDFVSINVAYFLQHGDANPGSILQIFFIVDIACFARTLDKHGSPFRLMLHMK